jgi:hypothetical protein
MIFNQVKIKKMMKSLKLILEDRTNRTEERMNRHREDSTWINLYKLAEITTGRIIDKLHEAAKKWKSLEFMCSLDEIDLLNDIEAMMNVKWLETKD